MRAFTAVRTGAGRLLLMILLLSLIFTFCSHASLSEKRLFRRHGIVVEDVIHTGQINIPADWAVAPGSFPIGLFWAIVDVLASDAGFHLASHRGATVDYVIYSVRGSAIPSGQAIVLRRGRNVIGAWVELPGWAGYGVSLRGKTLAEITGRPFGEWLEAGGIVQFSEGWGVGRKSAEDAVKAFLAALDAQDYAAARAFISPGAMLKELLYNRRPGDLVNGDWESGGLWNIARAKLLRITGITAPAVPYAATALGRVAEAKHFFVEADFRYHEVISDYGGRAGRFIVMVQETPDGPWLVDEVNSGH